MNQAVRVAVIGLGVGMRHADAIVAHPRAQLIACCDIDPEKRAEAAARLPGVRIAADAATVLRDPDVDVVVIASYDNVHAAQIEEAIAHGKHVFAEKPLCSTFDEAQRIAALLRKHPNIRLSSNLILRKSPRFMLVRDMVARGDFGDLFAIEGGYHFGRIEKITEGWRGRIPFYSAVYGGGVHIVDLLRWVASDEIVRVTAYGNRIATRGSQFQYRDTIVSILEFRSGIIGKVAVYFGSVDPHF
ncbi:MAG: Gfo/Idh/MocA family oxidoreductase, partial [bacterium]|nr:Gfo/Idh/MocA family oxidoreductase [bacterium]